MQRPDLVPVGLVRADETRQRNCTGIAEELCDFANAADVFLAIFLGKSEILVYPQANVVAIEAIGQFAHREQRPLQCNRDRALAAAGKTREPDRRPFLVQDLVPVLT